MRTEKQIIKNIKYLQEEIYRLKQEEDYSYLNNQSDINILQSEISMLAWVLN
jgi:hypothetical protein